MKIADLPFEMVIEIMKYCDDVVSAQSLFALYQDCSFEDVNQGKFERELEIMHNSVADTKATYYAIVTNGIESRLVLKRFDKISFGQFDFESVVRRFDDQDDLEQLCDHADFNQNESFINFRRVYDQYLRELVLMRSMFASGSVSLYTQWMLRSTYVDSLMYIMWTERLVAEICMYEGYGNFTFEEFRPNNMYYEKLQNLPAVELIDLYCDAIQNIYLKLYHKFEVNRDPCFPVYMWRGKQKVEFAMIMMHVDALYQCLFACIAT
jgi:hypothetical protein